MKRMSSKRLATALLSATLIFSSTWSSFALQPDVENDVNFTGDVVYQIMTDRFCDGDQSNNPTGDLFSADKSNLKKYLGGDWQGIIDKINDGYITDMGVTAIWISQPVENIYAVLNDTLGSTSYHGYWARDFKRTNPYFGSMADFERLISTAHAHGLKVIIDFAPNHTSPADQDNPSYMENGVLADDGVIKNGYSNDTNGYFYHNGGTDFSTIEDGTYRNLFDLADFNHQNAYIDDYLKTAIKLWLDKGIDGIRMDAVKHMPLGWQKSFMDEVYNHRQVFTFGEWFLSKNEVDPSNHDFANESGMSLLDFRYAQKLRQVLRDGTEDWVGFNNMIQSTDYDYNEVNDQVTFIDNHDMDRFKFEGSDPKKVDMALVVTLTSRGVPNIYYGTEQYMDGNGDPENRKFMTGFDRSTNAYKVIQKLSAVRHSNPALAYGSTEQRWINNDVYVYERKFGDNTVLVAVNKSSTSSYDLTGLKTALPEGQYTDILEGVMDGNSIEVSSTGDVTPFTLSPNESGVWVYQNNSGSPLIGHVGPMLGEVGSVVTIDGEGFGSQTGSVKFGQTEANIVSWSDDQVKVTVPNVSSGMYDINVVTSSGNTSNTYDKYEVASGRLVSARFVVNNAYTSLGENVYLVGNVEELGNWDTSKAVGPMYNSVIKQYPTWYYDVSVPGNTNIEYKFIKKDQNGNVTWESGSNHVITTPDGTTGEFEVNWQ